MGRGFRGLPRLPQDAAPLNRHEQGDRRAVQVIRGGSTDPGLWYCLSCTEATMFWRDVLREEDECGVGGGGAYYSTSQALDKKEDLETWWNDVSTAIPKFPMYAIFLATEGDTEVVSFVEKHRRELKDMSGEKCCFVYFRDLDVASELGPWTFSQHAALAYQIAR